MVARSDSARKRFKRGAVEPPASPQHLCLQCGMCCDGTVFADVRLSLADTARMGTNKQVSESFRQAPLPTKLRQPCPAWIEGKCAIYGTRPDHCRNFNCVLLKKAMVGEVSTERALKIIRACRRKADKVRSLLREMGDTNEQLAVTTRFRRMMRNCESRACDEHERELLAKLTLAAHDLNRALARHIYP